MAMFFLGFWNIENLFAPEGFPGREPWIAEAMKGDLKGWTKALFDRKISQLTKIISGMNAGKGPDLLGVCEVENKYCMDELCNSLNARLGARAYKPVHFDSTKDQRGIDTAFICDSKRLKPVAGELFTHFVLRRTGTRDITQVTFQDKKSGRQFVALANHWPSRSGGPASDSQGFRMTAGETLGYWHSRILEEKGPIPVVAMGDLNDDPADPSVRIHALGLRERDDVEGGTSPLFYNLAWEYLNQEVTTVEGGKRTIYGTLYYQGNANIFDQILVSKPFLKVGSGIRLIENSARIEATAEMVASSKNEGPIRFGLPKGNVAKNVNQNGFSDHFPVSVQIDIDEAVG